MTIIETDAEILTDKILNLALKLPQEIKAGKYHITLKIADSQTNTSNKKPFKISSYPYGLVHDDYSFRREDMYDLDGR